MIDSSQFRYVPVLRWKRAEKNALCDLFRHTKFSSIPQLTPLIELVPNRFTSPEKEDVDKFISEAAEGILQNWGCDPIFVDLWHLPTTLKTNSGQHPLNKLFIEATYRHLSVIPVTSLGRDKAYQQGVSLFIKNHAPRVCLRLTLNEVVQPNLNKDLDELLNYFFLKPEQVDLILDFQYLSDVALNAEKYFTIIPHLTKWQSCTFLGGAFPVDLQEFKVGKQIHQRFDWQSWKNMVINNSCYAEASSSRETGCNCCNSSKACFKAVKYNWFFN